MESTELLHSLRGEIAGIHTSHRAAVVMKIAAKYYKHAPRTDDALLDFCAELIASRDSDLFAVATLWIKRRKAIIDLRHSPVSRVGYTATSTAGAGATSSATAC